MVLELAELKLITASNLINLRTAHGMTQAELGAKLNYSDKTISKWERGEAIPDAFVLTQIAELFGVTVDDLLSSNSKWEPPPDESAGPEFVYSTDRIIALVMVGIFTLSLTVFVTLWMLRIIEWRVFLVGLSAALLTYMILDLVLKKGRHLQYVLALFVLSLFVLAYFFLPKSNPWQLFLLAAPAVALVFLACNIKKPVLRETLKKLHKD
ncbi:MAG: helix-turn-helix transcriptional regulator [Oscillospiraceae bacterium]|nr:helix-turn-helix transcriptional regulator [Oscillospiraceae bacterium]